MLSQKAKYALQALSYLAAHHKESMPVMIGTIARERNIPIKFLEAILCELKNNEILISIRGRNGGYLLAAPPQSVNLARVIRVIDGPIALLSCVSLNFYKACANCNPERCGINPIMAEVRDATLKILEKRTLKDIMDHQVEKNLNLFK
jgi:Rrf2 family protein